MKFFLEDISFLIPLRIDSVIRIENLLAIIRYIQRNFKSNITVLEASAYNNGLLKKILNHKVKYMFFEDKDPVFYRTKYCNILAKACETKFLSIWDTDVLVDKNQIVDSMEKLRNEEADMAYPFDGRFYDTSEIIRTLYMQKPQMNILHNNCERMSLIYGDNHKGGAFFANTEKYLLSGMENEFFYGWGAEDFERYERWINMQFKVYRSFGPMYHFSHPRDLNGQYRSIQQQDLVNSELTKISKSSRDELYKQMHYCPKNSPHRFS